MSNFGLESQDQDALRATATGGLQAGGAEYASWWSRVGAYLIDSILLGFGLLVVVIIGGVINLLIGRPIGPTVSLILIVLWLLFWALGYWVYFEGGESGQTLGKRALGIRVRDVSGDQASYGQAFGRNLVARIIGIIPLVGLLDVLWPLWDKDKQCLHDKAGSTVVVRA